MGSQPRGSRYVEEMVSDGTVCTYKSELSVVDNAFQRQRQIQTYLIVDRQFNSGLLHLSPGRKKSAVMWVMTWMILH